MVKTCLGLGTNIGNKKENIETAIRLLTERVGTILALSSVYETEPWGFDSANTFFNSALILETTLSPGNLLKTTRQIEIEMGRIEKSNGNYADRIIDIDILLYGNEIIQTPNLTIPHPMMHRRSFVLEPLAEIAPEILHPVFQKTWKELLDVIPNP
ncbi:2-amino-4-hydroxy-6-hydroxymethyldihydropteridine diphosphokinase [Parabacteroides sp. PF5-9]|uniref:2-amino-4-hydroxy-6- hydroxymethyldihydropteridine diphosphokinase n=1 Tax=Parabacteroides sp. PF5-9 TaxID=1742404 RepID=UPI0024730A96|nr:2-amino-4-hydroxy-6-hydroxymethyldihydropteridine diphosphokinase [Parabacteroides sp. PF5-9]MDH6359219.1 2-amino-4-hydroxy-6-hydroxymethyldihydropteridine diphosphokinase [Parabacteroides sp. PF5-9]